MQITSLFLAVILGVTVAGPLENVPVQPGTAVRNSALEELFLGVIEDFRELMLTGSEDVPVLDPFELDHLHLELEEFGLDDGSHITLEEIDARKLSTFVIDDLSVVMTSILLQRYSIEIEGHIPVLEVDFAKYDLSVTALGFTVFGSGEAKMRIIEPRIKATLEAAISILGGISITLRNAHVVFQLQRFEPEVTGMFHNDATNDFMNAFLSSLVPEMVEFFEEDITEFLSALVLEVGNEILENIDILGRMGQDAAVLMVLPALEAGQDLI